jgi:hypothetical protein
MVIRRRARSAPARRPVELDDNQGLALEPTKAQPQPVNALNVNMLATSAIGIDNGIHRQLTSLGHQCDVVAPSLIPTKPGDRVKTKNGRWHRVDARLGA